MGKIRKLTQWLKNDGCDRHWIDRHKFRLPSRKSLVTHPILSNLISTYVVTSFSPNPWICANPVPIVNCRSRRNQQKAKDVSQRHFAVSTRSVTKVSDPIDWCTLLNVTLTNKTIAITILYINSATTMVRIHLCRRRKLLTIKMFVLEKNIMWTIWKNVINLTWTCSVVVSKVFPFHIRSSMANHIRLKMQSRRKFTHSVEPTQYIRLSTANIKIQLIKYYCTYWAIALLCHLHLECFW